MRLLVLSWCLVCLLSGCGNLPKPEMKHVDTTSIVLADSRFPREPVVVYAAAIYCGSKESAAWKGDAGRAEIFVLNADEGCFVDTPLKQEDEVALYFNWLKKTGVRFQGERIETDTALGTIWGRRFMREDRECYFFRHDFEAYHFSHYSDPTTFMVGYFCAPSENALDDASIRQFVTSISLSDKPSIVKKPYVASSTTTVASTLAPKQNFDRAVVGRRNPPERDVTYSLSGKWAGIADVVTGKFDYKRRATSGTFELQLPAATVPCRGSWERIRYDLDGFTITARWTAKCPGTPKATGQFRYVSEELAEMYGADEKRNFISFSLLGFKRQAATAADSTQMVPFAWEGVVTEGLVFVKYGQFEGPGSLTFADADGVVDCKGGWFLDGRWSADCSNGRKLAGKSFRFQFGTILGAGKDDLGRSFRFGKS